jgi:hypothetical protein
LATGRERERERERERMLDIKNEIKMKWGRMVE